MTAEAQARKDDSKAVATEQTKYPNKVTEHVHITPEIAEAWLTKNLSNRTVRAAHVRRLASDMAAHKWVETDEPIRFDRNGRLIDGQHRLAACVLAQTGFDSVVVYGYDPKVQDYIDAGVPRTPSDVLTMAGHANAAQLTQTLRLIYLEGRGYSVNSSSRACSRQSLLSILGQHPDLPKYIVQQNLVPRGIPASQLSYIRYVAHKHLGRGEEAERFFNVIRTGVPDYEGCPAHAFRERVISGAILTQTRTGVRAETWKLMKHAFNLFCEERIVRILRSPPGANVRLLDFDPEKLLDGVEIEDGGVTEGAVSKVIKDHFIRS